MMKFEWTVVRSTALCCLLAVSSSTYATDLSISSVVNGNTATLTAANTYGGAIRSFTYRGVEYINTHDLGRELQSAVAFDMYGECYNPTEAGNRSGTPSQLLAWSNAGNTLYTSTNMAFWLMPGQTGGTCFNGATAAVNSTVFSNLVFEKWVQFGSSGVQNVLNYSVKYNINASEPPHSYAIYEALTGYLPFNFSKWFTFDPRTSTLTALPLGTSPVYQGLPVIASVVAGTSAMGIYASVQPTGNYGAQYVMGGGTVGTNKWNAVYVESSAAPGSTYQRDFKVPFGTIEEVTTAMRAVSVGLTNTLIPVFRFWGWNDHFLTTSYSEAASIGAGVYQFEGTGFRVYQTPQDGGMIPLYRCNNVSATDHFVSTASNCEGMQYEGVYGYVSSYARAGYEPIYRFYKSSISDHLTTTDYSEGVNAGYVYESTIGYAPTANY